MESANSLKVPLLAKRAVFMVALLPQIGSILGQELSNDAPFAKSSNLQESFYSSFRESCLETDSLRSQGIDPTVTSLARTVWAHCNCVVGELKKILDDSDIRSFADSDKAQKSDKLRAAISVCTAQYRGH